MIEIIYSSNSFSGIIKLPEKKALKFLQKLQKDYLKTVSRDSFLKVKIEKL